MTEFLVRVGRPAALLGALLGIAGDAYHFTLDERSEVAMSLGYRAHGIALMIAFLLAILALLRIALVQSERWGVVGRVGFILALAGTITTIGDIWAEAIVLPGMTSSAPELLNEDATGFHLGAVAFVFLGLFALGWLLVAVASFRAGQASRPACALLGVAAVIAGLPIGGSYILLLLAVAWLSMSVRAEVEVPSSAP
jgi:hypothetical protein